MSTIFQTPRLTIRRWRAEDHDGILRLYSDPAVIPYIDDGAPIPAEDVARWMEVTKRTYTTRGYGMFAIDTAEPACIGYGGLVHPGGAPDAEVKYAFTPAMWGKGLATEFVNGLVAYAWSLGLPRLTSTVDRRNAASRAVLAKAGFAFIRWEIHADGAQIGHYALEAPV